MHALAVRSVGVQVGPHREDTEHQLLHALRSEELVIGVEALEVDLYVFLELRSRGVKAICELW